MKLISFGRSIWKSVNEIANEARMGTSLKINNPASQGEIRSKPTHLPYPRWVFPFDRVLMVTSRL